MPNLDKINKIQSRLDNLRTQVKAAGEIKGKKVLVVYNKQTETYSIKTAGTLWERVKMAISTFFDRKVQSGRSHLLEDVKELRSAMFELKQTHDAGTNTEGTACFLRSFQEVQGAFFEAGAVLEKLYENKAFISTLNLPKELAETDKFIGHHLAQYKQEVVSLLKPYIQTINSYAKDIRALTVEQQAEYMGAGIQLLMLRAYGFADDKEKFDALIQTYNSSENAIDFDVLEKLCSGLNENAFAELQAIEKEICEKKDLSDLLRKGLDKVVEEQKILEDAKTVVAAKKTAAAELIRTVELDKIHSNSAALFGEHADDHATVMLVRKLVAANQWAQSDIVTGLDATQALVKEIEGLVLTMGFEKPSIVTSNNDLFLTSSELRTKIENTIINLKNRSKKIVEEIRVRDEEAKKAAAQQSTAGFYAMGTTFLWNLLATGSEEITLETKKGLIDELTAQCERVVEAMNEIIVAETAMKETNAKISQCSSELVYGKQLLVETEDTIKKRYASQKKLNAYTEQWKRYEACKVEVKAEGV